MKPKKDECCCRLPSCWFPSLWHLISQQSKIPTKDKLFNSSFCRPRPTTYPIRKEILGHDLANCTLKFPHLPIVSLIFPQIHFCLPGGQPTTLPHPGMPWLWHWTQKLPRLFPSFYMITAHTPINTHPSRFEVKP